MAGLLDFLGMGGGEGPGLLGNLQSAFASPEMERIAMALQAFGGNEHAQKAMAEAPQRRAQAEGFKAMLPSIMNNPDIDPAVKAAIQRNPAMAAKLFENMSKPAETKPHNVGDVVGAWDSRRGGNFSPQFVAPKVMNRGPEDTTLSVTPDVPGIPRAPAQGDPNFYGGAPARNPNLAPMGLPPQAPGPQSNLGPGTQVLAAPPAPTNPFAAPGKTTEEMNKNSLYARRMFTAEGIFRNPDVTKAALSVANRAAGALPMDLGNMLVPETYQQFDQARRNFINATLRRESGAVISTTEMTDGNKQYFPTPGDTPKVLEQKRQNRVDAMREIAGGAGPHFRPENTDVLSPVNSSPAKGAGPKADQGRVPQMPTVGEVKDGYRYRGGNPADPNSWERTR